MLKQLALPGIVEQNLFYAYLLKGCVQCTRQLFAYEHLIE